MGSDRKKERKKGERMAAQVKLALPPIPKILLKLCLFGHILLVSIAFLGFAPGGFYLYLNLLFFGLLLLHLHLPTHPETVHLALATNLVSIVHDVVALGVLFPSGLFSVFSLWFSFFAFIGNIALRFFSSFIIYREWVSQAGSEGGTVIQVSSEQSQSA